MTQCLRALAWWSELISLNTDDKGETWCCHFVHWQPPPPPPHIQMHGRLYTQTHMHTHIHIINKCFKYSSKFNICYLKTFKTSTLINLSASNIGQNSDMAGFFFSMRLTSSEVHNQFLGLFLFPENWTLFTCLHWYLFFKFWKWFFQTLYPLL